MQEKYFASILVAILVPCAYLLFLTPLGMDTTDFGYFYGYAWRILNGEVPYRDFFYIKPAFPLYWHAFWLKLTPFEYQILAGKAGFCLTILASSWLGALSLHRLFRLQSLRVDTPFLATTAFVFSIHTFPHMPWHTADGVLFSSASLWLALSAHPGLSGLGAACAVLCKQSFALVPIAILLALHFRGSSIKPFLLSFLAAIAIWLLWLVHNDAWQNFTAMTTGQLALSEALDAGIFIYLKQNWLLPLAALSPLVIFRILQKPLPNPLAPAFCYLGCLAIWYVHTALSTRTWIGFGSSWPTLFVCLGGIAVVAHRFFLSPFVADARGSAFAFAAALLIAWSCAISGGYKIPAFFSPPLLLAFFLWHARLFQPSRWLPWLTLATGLLIFQVGWLYPYTFPIRPLAKNDLVHDAGAIYPQAKGVLVDRDMLERLTELKALRAKFGPDYKTLPGFTLAYFLNGDKPVIKSDWLIDWEINGRTDELFNELAAKNAVVFMERDQLEATSADGYARAGYTVPQRIRHEWKIIEETPHFVVFQKP